MRMTPPTFGDDADAARHLVRHLRRMLLVYYSQDTVAAHTITEHHVDEVFAHNARFRRDLALQGINPDTLAALTDEGRTIISAIINGWVRALRLPPEESERSSSPGHPRHHP